VSTCLEGDELEVVLGLVYISLDSDSRNKRHDTINPKHPALHVQVSSSTRDPGRRKRNRHDTTNPKHPALYVQVSSSTQDPGGQKGKPENSCDTGSQEFAH
jgi:hypothetical protein